MIFWFLRGYFFSEFVDQQNPDSWISFLLLQKPISWIQESGMVYVKWIWFLSFILLKLLSTQIILFWYNFLRDTFMRVISVYHPVSNLLSILHSQWHNSNGTASHLWLHRIGLWTLLRLQTRLLRSTSTLPTVLSFEWTCHRLIRCRSVSTMWRCTVTMKSNASKYLVVIIINIHVE